MSFQQYRPTGFRVLPPIVKNIIIINILFYLATFAFKNVFQTDLYEYLAFHYVGSSKFAPYQFITYMFMHGGIGHIFFNMFAVWMFGSALENVWGPKRFLVYYFITGIGAAIIHSLVLWYELAPIKNAVLHYYNDPSLEAFTVLIQNHFNGYYNPLWFNEFISMWQLNPTNPEFIQESINSSSNLLQARLDIPTVGASGAVFGVLLAFGMLFPNSLIYIYFLFPIKAKWFVIIYGAIELYAGISNSTGDNVAHFAHLGGMIFGFLLIKFWNKRNRKTLF
ncbi:rhomboid family intramembrane serine protease [Bacteroidota bacterium]